MLKPKKITISYYSWEDVQEYIKEKYAIDINQYLTQLLDLGVTRLPHIYIHRGVSMSKEERKVVDILLEEFGGDIESFWMIRKC